MFGWFKKKRDVSPPPTEPEGAGGEPAEFRAVRGRVAFANDQRQWEETFDGVEALRDALLARGREPATEGNVIVDTATGLRCQPVLVSFQPIHPVGAQTTTTIEVSHPVLGNVRPMEFQHSSGGSTIESIAAGFDQWCQSDLVALADAVNPAQGECMSMRYETKAEGDEPARRRRVILGPTVHLQTEPPAESSTEEHAFCPCCLFTRSLDAFKPLLDADGVKALRLFAMRGSDGTADADCRVNGEDYAAGKQGLIAYVAAWPPAGIEYRKQYVIVQDAPAES